MSVLSARTAGRGRLARGGFRGRLFRGLGTVPAVAGIAYTVSWVAGLALPVPNLSVSASGAEVIARYADHVAAVQAQFALTEGLPAIGLAIVAGALARAAHRSGARRLSLITAVSGAIAAVISLTQYALGAVLAGAAVPGHATGQAGALFEAVNRLDGVKMFALAVLALAGAALAGKAGPAGSGPAPPLAAVRGRRAGRDDHRVGDRLPAADRDPGPDGVRSRGAAAGLRHRHRRGARPQGEPGAGPRGQRTAGPSAHVAAGRGTRVA